MSKKIIVLTTIILIVFILFGVLKIQDEALRAVYPITFQEYIYKYSEKYEVDEYLIYAIIKAESNFNENSESSKGAKGLMQLMDDTAKDVAKKADLKYVNTEELLKNILNPEININLGTKYISILINKYQNINVALAAYNAGIGVVDSWIEKGTIKSDGSDIENIPYKETNNYVRKILRDYKIYKNLY